jgi:hypothetical protein
MDAQPEKELDGAGQSLWRSEVRSLCAVQGQKPAGAEMLAAVAHSGGLRDNLSIAKDRFAARLARFAVSRSDKLVELEDAEVAAAAAEEEAVCLPALVHRRDLWMLL